VRLSKIFLASGLPPPSSPPLPSSANTPVPGAWRSLRAPPPSSSEGWKVCLSQDVEIPDTPFSASTGVGSNSTFVVYPTENARTAEIWRKRQILTLRGGGRRGGVPCPQKTWYSPPSFPSPAHFPFLKMCGHGTSVFCGSRRRRTHPPSFLLLHISHS